MKDKKSKEEILQGFQVLRNEQRTYASKINELQADLAEHKIVIENLEKVDGDRKCYRMVGGVLVERTVKEVIPALVNNRDKLTKLIESLNTQLTDKGAEINGYMEKYNIQIKDQGGESKKEEKEEEVKSGGVLVQS
eukprot:TRINITY_DN1345_c0_g1_i1.p1 TRINITY_DN1345_c0_g1~~TRINITY_DN1345_c0_g1_i1.p1  ORF type:complete len:136 (+),score=50.34 TRINITY_DN1345_c0_g1_i1:38-445(+)